MALKILEEDSFLGKKISKLEDLMKEEGLSIQGHQLTISFTEENSPDPTFEFHIGRDSNVFPRDIDEPFWKD